MNVDIYVEDTELAQKRVITLDLHRNGILPEDNRIEIRMLTTDPGLNGRFVHPHESKENLDSKLASLAMLKN